MFAALRKIVPSGLSTGVRCTQFERQLHGFGQTARASYAPQRSWKEAK